MNDFIVSVRIRATGGVSNVSVKLETTIFELICHLCQENKLNEPFKYYLASNDLVLEDNETVGSTNIHTITSFNIPILCKKTIYRFEEASNYAKYLLHTDKGDDIFSKKPTSDVEEAYYEKCKNYHHITGMPIISISDDIFNDNIESASTLLQFVIDEDFHKFDVETFLNQICDILNISIIDIKIEKVQIGCVSLLLQLFEQCSSIFKISKIKALWNSLIDKAPQLGILKVVFSFLGDQNSLDAKQKYRDEIILNGQWNRIYGIGHTYWNGPLTDGRDRGGYPYYCPAGWKRYSFYVTDDFDNKFKGWHICYHGTKFACALSILLSGLKPAKIAKYGAGIYASPSINYACHPRYAEIKETESSYEETFFKLGTYVQFVLECRVHPSNIIKIGNETLSARSDIDCNVSNDVIEWVIDAKGKSIIDFNDPHATIVATGLMVRITDNHPGYCLNHNGGIIRIYVI